MSLPRRTIVLATGNPGKLREIKAVLGELPVDVVGLGGCGPIPEPPEEADTFAANARDKALHYARATGQWCLADDSGLVVDALGGLPGVRSARYAAERCQAGAGRACLDPANNAKLLEALRDVPDPRRTARFVCHLALADPQRVLLEADGAIEGLIGHAPRGDNGFGYDPLFIVPALGCTTAQLPEAEKNRISHRGQAVRSFRDKLRQLLRQCPT